MNETNDTGVLKQIPVFYTPKMVANFSSFSPSAGKPARVVGAWQRLGLPIEIIDFEPVGIKPEWYFWAEFQMLKDLKIGKRRVGKECLRLCRSRWSPDH